MINKYNTVCPKCTNSRKKSGQESCSVLQYQNGLSLKCFHCGYKEFVFSDDVVLPEQVEIVKPEFQPIPKDELPFKDDITTFYPYYRNGEKVLIIARRVIADGDKWIRPFSYTVDGWVMTVPPGKMLYKSELLHSDDRPVLVVEGEKTADAAALIFKNYDVVTWRGGSKNVANGDWDLLKGRKIVLWPDADETGVSAMETIGNTIISDHIYIVDVSDLPPKSDLADNFSLDLIKRKLSTKKKIEADLFQGEFDPKMLQELHKRDMKYTPFGFANMDKYVQLPPTGVVVISGRTNHGKTAFMINTAVNLALHTDKIVLYLSLEFPVEELNLRMLKTIDGTTHSQSGWEDDTYFNTCLRDLSTQSAKDYYNLLLSRKLRLADNSIKVREILEVMDKCAELGKDLVIFVDYLQIIPLENTYKNRYEQLKDMIEVIREHANKNRQLLIGGSQLTAGDTPYTDSVRESKDLENTAALHLRVWNKLKGQEKKINMYEDIPGDIVIHVEKSRQNNANGKSFGFYSPNGCKLVPAAYESKEF